MESHEHSLVPFGEPLPAAATDAGEAPPAALVEKLVAAGETVVVTLVPEDPGDPEPDPGLLAAASVYAWLGVRAFQVPESQAPALRQVLDMVASIQGTRKPALSRRGLA